MIRKNFLNFESNLREAFLYRQSLKNLPRSKEGLLVADQYSKLNVDRKFRFFQYRTKDIASAERYNSFYKNYSLFIFYHNKNLISFYKQIENFKKENSERLKKYYKAVKNLRSSSKENNIRLNTRYNKVFIKSVFSEKDFQEKYDLFDNKTETTLIKKEQANYKLDCIQLPSLIDAKVPVIRAELDDSLSYMGSNLHKLNVSSETSFIYRPEKVYNYIVGEEEFIKLGKIKPYNEVRIKIIFSFNGIKEINSFYIQMACELPAVFEENCLEYYDGSTWQPISFSKIELDNRCRFFFDDVETNKVRLSIKQSKYYDTISLIDEDRDKLLDLDLKANSKLLNINTLKESKINRVYDLSIAETGFSYRKNKSFGFYREANVINLNQCLTINYNLDFAYEDPDTFIEKSIHLVLYGEDNIRAFKKLKSNFNMTPRYNKIVSVPSSKIIEKEVLVFKRREAKVLGYPSLETRSDLNLISDRIKLKKNNSSLTMFEDYTISLDGGATYLKVDEEVSELQKKFSQNISGFFYVKIEDKSNASDIYSVEYDIASQYYADESRKVSIVNGEVVLDKSLTRSVGFARPSLIMRSKSKNNNSSLISEYSVLIEELEENQESFIEYETFLEEESRGTDNVV